MGYVNRRRTGPAQRGDRGDRLGFFIVDDLLAVAATVKGIQAIANSATTAFSSGHTTDEQRKARAAFFGQSALDGGSITAARYLLGGIQNTGSHEQPYYQDWINRLAGDDFGSQVLAQAEAQGPKWAANIPDPGGTQQMFNDVKRDLLALGASAPPTPGQMITPATPATPARPGSPSTPGRPVQQLPAMQTTAPYNWTPWLLAVGLGVGAAVASPHLRKH